jgi:MFS family permease
MIYLRGRQGPREQSVGMVRICTAASLIAYPFGALILALGPDTLATMLVGYGLILVALVTYAPLIGTSLQRVVGEETKLLDEYELRLRGRALSASYAIFSGLALLLVIYAAIATDNGLWVPRTYEAFNGLFWGVFLYASVLPTAVLSWMVEPSFGNE